MTSVAAPPDDRIIGLPTSWKAIDGSIMDLSIVPEGPSGPDDPDLYEKTVTFLQYGLEIMAYRKLRIMATEGYISGLDPDKEKGRELLRCERDPAYFMTVWCHAFEFRPQEGQKFPWYKPEFNGWMPFILMPYQVRMVRWLQRRMSTSRGVTNGAISKSRDMGATEVCCKYALWDYLFTTPSHSKFVSRMGDLVDQVGNLDSMMERAVSHIIDEPQNMALPYWMIPEGFVREYHRKERLVLHPTLRNMMSGEATTSRTGRGGRCKIIFLDEYNFIKGLRTVLSACQQTTSHLIGLSSESVEENADGLEWREDLARRDPDAVFVIEYWDHYFHDAAWLAMIREKYGDDYNAFLREVMRQAEAGFGGWMYPEARELSVIPETRNCFIKPRPDEIEHNHYGHVKVYWGVDPGIDDKTAIWVVMHDPACGRDTVINAWEFTNREGAEYVAAVLCGVPYDANGRWVHRDADGNILHDFFFPPKTQEFMQFLLAIPEPEMIFGDPYGENEHAGEDDAWFPRMMRFWRLHNPRGKRAWKIVVNWNPEKRTYQGRRLAMKNWLKRLDFNGGNRMTQRALESLQKSRWDDDPNKPRQVAQKTAKHDEWSDLRTAGEFVITGLEMIGMIEEKRGKDGKVATRRYDPKANPRGKPRDLKEDAA